jgi:CSLREA domain-containing protein
MQKPLLLCAAILTLVLAQPAPAAVFNISNGDVAALKAAITTANTNGASDIINLAPNGLYTLTAVDNSVNGANGLPEIGNDAAALDLTINGNGARIQRSAAAGTPEFRILTIGNGASLDCTGLTIANGKLGGSASPASFGGGIYNNAGSLTATNCTITANSASKGAGLYSFGGTIVLTNADVTENVSPATGAGGGICNEGQLTVVDSRVNLNTAGAGGGINNSGKTTLRRTAVSDNTASNGGGVYNINTLALENSTLHGNRAIDSGGPTGSGGGIWNSSVAELENSTLSNNSALSGGGVENSSGALTLTSCTLSRNTATKEGGAVRNIAGSMNIRCTTFAFNSANGSSPTSPGAGAIQNNSTSNNPAITFHNTVFQQGASGPNILSFGGPVISKGHNLCSDGGGGNSTTGPGGFFNGSGDIRNTAANLGSLQNNGGVTLTHAPVFPSAAIDAGDDLVLEAPLSLMTDQRGPGFPRRRGTRVDIGAIETGVALVVTTLDDHDDGNCTATDCTLREAIAATNAAGSGNVSFARGLTGTIQLGGALPDVGANLVLQGPGANLLTVRRNSGGDYRIFTIRNGTSNGPTVEISGLTISNGQAPALMFPEDSGGGILNDRGWLFVTACVITGNSAAPSVSSFGGGLLNRNGGFLIEDSTISGNTAGSGGGVASSMNVSVFTLTEIVTTTLINNTALGGNGGAVYSEAKNAGSAAYFGLANCTLSGNSATASGFVGGAGGAIFNFGFNSGEAGLGLEDCTIANNHAPNTGGIYNNNFNATATVALRNNIFKCGATGGNLLNSSGQIQSLGHNLCDDFAGDATNTGTGPGGYLNATGDVRNTDPLLGPLQDNGGPTLTHALLNGSPAINAGYNGDFGFIDQRGFLRRGSNDIGAFEYNAGQLRIVNVARSGNDLVVSFEASAGFAYRLVRKSSAGDAAWQSLSPEVVVAATTDGILQLTDPGGALLGHACYRIELLVK